MQQSQTKFEFAAAAIKKKKTHDKTVIQEQLKDETFTQRL